MLVLRNELNAGCKWEIRSPVNSITLGVKHSIHGRSVTGYSPKKSDGTSKKRQFQLGKSASSCGVHTRFPEQ